MAVKLSNAHLYLALKDGDDLMIRGTNKNISKRWLNVIAKHVHS